MEFLTSAVSVVLIFFFFHEKHVLITQFIYEYFDAHNLEAATQRCC